jgi:hypothetical protein
MGRRYTTEVYSLYDNKVQIDLIDDDLSVDLTTPWEIANMELSMDKPGDPIWAGIKRKSASIIWRISTTAEESILEAIASSQEDRFFVKIYINEVLEFYGPILTDGMMIEESGLPYDAMLTVSDGFAYLKENITPLTYVSAFDLVMQILRETDPIALIDDTDPFCTTCVRWFENSWTYADSFNPFARWRFGGELNVVRDVDSGEWFDYYTILERLVMTFGARVELSGGRYRITQFSEMSSGELMVHTYQKNYSAGNINLVGEAGILQNGVALDILEIEGDPSIARVDNGARFGFMPRLKKVERIYNYDGYELLYNRNNVNTSPAFYVANVVKQSSDSYISITGRFFIDLTNSSPSQAYTYRPKFEIQIKLDDGVDTSYWKGQIWEYPVAIPTATYLGDVRTIYYLQSNFYTELINIQTAEIPIGGGLTVSIVGSIVDLNDNPIANIVLNQFSCQQLRIQHNPSDATSLRESLFRVEDPDSKSSKVDVVPDSFIGDGPSELTNGRIQVRTTAPLAWSDSSTWRVKDSGAYRGITGLQLQEIMRHFSVPRRKYDMVMSGFLSTHKVLEYYGRILMFNSQKWNLNEDQSRAEMIELDRVTTDFDDVVVDINQGVVLQTFSDSSMPSNSGLPGLPVGGTTGVVNGTTSTISVAALDTDGPVAGQTVVILNTVSGESQRVVLAADWDATDTTISVEEIEVAGTFPIGALVMVPADEASQALNRRSSGYLAGLPVSENAIGDGISKIEVDTLTGDFRAEGSDIRFPGLPIESEATTGQICIDTEGRLKVKA